MAKVLSIFCISRLFPAFAIAQCLLEIIGTNGMPYNNFDARELELAMLETYSAPENSLEEHKVLKRHTPTSPPVNPRHFWATDPKFDIPIIFPNDEQPRDIVDMINSIFSGRSINKQSAGSEYAAAFPPEDL